MTHTIRNLTQELTYWPKAYGLLAVRVIKGWDKNETVSAVAGKILRREYRCHWLRG